MSDIKNDHDNDKMNESSINDSRSSFGMSLRPRRVLSDISNTFTQGLNTIRRVTSSTTKKKRSLENTDPNNSIISTKEEDSSFIEREHIDLDHEAPIKTRAIEIHIKENNEEKIEKIRSPIHIKLDKQSRSSNEMSVSNITHEFSHILEDDNDKLITTTTTTTSSSILSINLLNEEEIKKKEAEKFFRIYGFYKPSIIQRKLPLITKGSDPCQCLEIIDDMYAFYKKNELQYSASPYFHIQREIQPKMRSILIDWIIEVHFKFKLNDQTIWLCVNILDRYLEKVYVPRGLLQLVGITSLFISSKFDGSLVPSVRDCVFLSDNAFRQQDILAMEQNILKELNYQLNVPIIYHFLIKYLSLIKSYNDRLKLITFYCAERGLQEEFILNYSPSLYASAAIYCGLRTIHHTPSSSTSSNVTNVWSRVLEEETGYKEEDLLECSRLMISYITSPPLVTSRRVLDSAKKKYNNSCTHYVSTLEYPTI